MAKVIEHEELLRFAVSKCLLMCFNDILNHANQALFRMDRLTDVTFMELQSVIKIVRQYCI